MAIHRLLSAVSANFLAALVLITVIQSVAFASEFNGKGKHEDWQKASLVFNAGNALVNAKDYKAAAAKYREAISIYPFDDDFYAGLGITLREQGDLTGAETQFRKALDLNPASWNTWGGLGKVYYKQHRYAEAKDAISQALKHNPPEDQKIGLEKSISIIDSKIAATTAPGGR